MVFENLLNKLNQANDVAMILMLILTVIGVVMSIIKYRKTQDEDSRDQLKALVLILVIGIILGGAIYLMGKFDFSVRLETIEKLCFAYLVLYFSINLIYYTKSDRRKEETDEKESIDEIDN